MLSDYLKARKLGERAYRKALIGGRYPYLPSLAEMVTEIDSFTEIDLGRAEIPMDMIVGTRRSGRKNAFAVNFMPLMEEKTEFAAKWSHLYDAQVAEGIRDPVKVYEFLNRFYVEEGNKRISVLRYVGAVTVYADVIRIRPPKTDTEQSRLYYEYLDFYKVTKSFEIVLSKPGRYEQLAGILGQNLRDPWPEELLKKLHSGFISFKSVFSAKEGERIGLTVGDAMLIYLGIYGLDSLVEESREEIRRRLMRLWREFVAASSPEGIAIIERREEAEKRAQTTQIRKAAKIVEKTVERTGAAGVTGAADIAGAFAGITAGAGAAAATRDTIISSLETVLPVHEETLDPAEAVYSPLHPLRIAFVYEKNADHSGWVYGHELGRNHLKEAFGSLVETMQFPDCGSEEKAREAFCAAREAGCRMIFAASPVFAHEALRFAVDHPGIRVLNCSCNQVGHALRFYYGKMFEAKFLMGALAASLTDDHRIGYIAGRKDSAALSEINAFARGAQLTDPFCRIAVQWLRERGTTGEGEYTDHEIPAEKEAGREGVRDCRIHIVSDIDMIRPEEESRRYGLYLRTDEGELNRLAAPLWNWGVFYEIVVRRMLDGSYNSVTADQKDRSMNYWMGLSSGLIDILMSDDLPEPSRRLLQMLRKGIEGGWIDPFSGRMRDREGQIHGEEDGVLTSAQILSMDWLMENVDEML